MRFLFTILMLLPMKIMAQSDSSYTADSTEVRAVIDKMFLGMKTSDSTLLGAQFSPQVRLLTTFRSNSGEDKLIEESLKDFKIAVGTPHDIEWDERISNVVIQIDDALAQVWMDYSFYLGDTFSHCGVNAMQLTKTSEGWKIIHIIDTRRRSDCH